MQRVLNQKPRCLYNCDLDFLLGERSNHEKATRTIFFIVIDRLQ